jgi:hypothetical protein
MCFFFIVDSCLKAETTRQKIVKRSQRMHLQSSANLRNPFSIPEISHLPLRSVRTEKPTCERVDL